jgi:hypothetical protein
MSLFSFQGTGHAVWRRELRILPKEQVGIKTKVNGKFTFFDLTTSLPARPRSGEERTPEDFVPSSKDRPGRSPGAPT